MTQNFDHPENEGFPTLVLSGVKGDGMGTTAVSL
jgi:hypothetical protein